MMRCGVAKTAAAALLLAVAAATAAAAQEETDSVLLLAPPRLSDAYYKDKRADLLAFYKRVIAAGEAQGENVRLIVAPDDRDSLLAAGFLAANMVAGELEDVWIRDVSAVQVGDSFFKFQYDSKPVRETDPEALDIINGAYRRFLAAWGIEFTDVALNLDGGGNLVVEQTKRRAIVTDRILDDNPDLTKKQIVDILKQQVGVTAAIVPSEPGDALAHADGMVTFLTPDTIGLLDYRADGLDLEWLWDDCVAALKAAFGQDVTIVALPYEPSDDMWGAFPSAQGDWANILRTNVAYYMPTFGLATDAKAEKIVGDNVDTNKYAVVPVDVRGVDIMGGAVNCLSWWLSGPQAVKFLEAGDVATATPTPAATTAAAAAPSAAASPGSSGGRGGSAGGGGGSGNGASSLRYSAQLAVATALLSVLLLW